MSEHNAGKVKVKEIYCKKRHSCAVMQKLSQGMAVKGV